MERTQVVILMANSEAAQSFRLSLEAKGYTCASFISVKKAFDTIDFAKCRVVVVGTLRQDDPPLNEVIRTIKSSAKGNLIVIGASSFEDSCDTLLDQGADAFFYTLGSKSISEFVRILFMK